MDTATHVVMGIAIGGLATLDPVVAENTVNSHSVLMAAIIGSQIPDIDTFLKLRNNAVYIRNHRGVTHSIPAVLFWPIVVTAFVSLFYPEANLLHLWLWSFAAVFLHVFVDIFNAYGTQALRPFSAKWVALGIINTFDPIIFGIHALGIILWILGAEPGQTFLTMYIVLIFYYLIRFIMQRTVRSALLKTIPDAEEIIIAPTMSFNQWRLAVTSKDCFYVGRAFKRSITIFDKFKRVPVPETPIIETAKKDKNISAFLSFSPVYRWEISEYNHYYEVRFIDLRYRSNGHYPFVAIVQLDTELNIITSYTGWIFSEEKLRKKLNVIVD
ncbi:metal-dependent hydrolase [Lederbergia citrea]|uniref:Metal-dependent hydrolase n=1 Tax=Lederbergia citrea TaxID=2833581 RepID=A0A942Z5H8_9BACI|nr:metal-dependent hydrolase [Lederbergia citrea]MBS4205777.1 metal-dependent hydrolase [Lederbergia citrea]MBS4224774.1 metal-dependent hydrolase [Lederbergia citrea]